MEAYQSGKAAKVAPPAVSNHTSLPSQTGPIVLTIVRRSASSRPSTGSRMPTPKSNPSSTKYPDHRIAMRMNQKVARFMTISSVLEDGQRLGGAGLFGLGRGAGLDVPDRQPSRDGGEPGVEPGEHGQRDAHRGCGHAVRDALGRGQQAEHGPRLAAHLGEDRAHRDPQIGQRQAPDRGSVEPAAARNPAT